MEPQGMVSSQHSAKKNTQVKWEWGFHGRMEQRLTPRAQARTVWPGTAQSHTGASGPLTGLRGSAACSSIWPSPFLPISWTSPFLSVLVMYFKPALSFTWILCF